MPRKTGSKNKPKFIIVSVDEIIKNFNPAASIRISSDYASLFGQVITPTQPNIGTETKGKEEEDEIQMTVED